MGVSRQAIGRRQCLPELCSLDQRLRSGCNKKIPIFVSYHGEWIHALSFSSEKLHVSLFLLKPVLSAVLSVSRMIAALELVETDEPRLPGDVLGHRRDWVVRYAPPMAGIVHETILERVDALVNVQHERIEVNALLLCRVHCVVEEIHQHCLATTDSAVDVEP